MSILLRLGVLWVATLGAHAQEGLLSSSLRRIMQAQPVKTASVQPVKTASVQPSKTATVNPQAAVLPYSAKRVPAVVRPRPVQGIRGEGFWTVKGSNYYDANGNEVWFSGVTWSGFETPTAVVHGLGKRSYTSHLDQMKALGFNMIRLAFAGETLLNTTMPTENIWFANPDLWGKNSLQTMDAIIAAAGERGIKIILDYHRIKLTVTNEAGLWYDKDTPESVWLNNWAMLATRYKGNPTIIGADLFNEVHPCPTMGCPDGAPFWVENAGVNEKYNFRSASIRAIQAISAIEPGWIFFLEGMYQNYWWGGNVAVLETAPINSPPGKIAYSAHEYGPYVYPAKQFFSPIFPNNMVPLMTQMWGFAQEQGIKPVWVGEFGSFYPDPTDKINRIERITFQTVIAYIKRIDASWTLAFWNPDSKDTGGILKDDYVSVNWPKLMLLRQIMHPDFGPSPP